MKDSKEHYAYIKFERKEFEYRVGPFKTIVELKAEIDLVEKRYKKRGFKSQLITLID